MSKAPDVKERLYGYQPKPMLIYDGDCGFCKYSVNYWHKLTGDTVKYKPYQEVRSQFPDISEETFKSAVQYIAPNGERASAAKASFLTLSHAPGKSFWLWLYRFLPGFAFFSELMYRWVARHRDFCFRVSKVLWGAHYEPPRYQLVAWLLMRGMGFIYLFAFLSFALQALGLIGSHGIVPVNNLLEMARQQLGAERYWYLPIVFWLNSSDLFIQTVCWGGVLLSMLLIVNILPRISLILLYILYLSLVYGGQVFMTFQWDLFLLEAGVIAIFLVGTTTLGIWLMRWLLFRFMFAGGLVKMFSGDPTWRDFTALQYYFFTEPLPTPLAWYANQLPEILLKAGAATTLFIELFAVLLIFFPRRMRFFAGFCILFLQTIILITGNYNFFNLQTILLCVVLLDDAALTWFVPKKLINLFSTNTIDVSSHRVLGFFAWVFAVVTVSVSIAQFNVRFRNSDSPFARSLVQFIQPLCLVNVYGPFAVMTTKRYEIIVEGSSDGEDWKTYEFKYKPGDLYQRPKWNIPFQPRLDWQMWFAALGSVYNNPWFEAFLRRLLEGSPDVLALMANNPFPDKPPLHIRAKFYDYHFTTFAERRKSGAWWTSEYVGDYYP